MRKEYFILFFEKYVVVILRIETIVSKMLNSAALSGNYTAITVVFQPFGNVFFFAVTYGPKKTELVDERKTVLIFYGAVCNRVFNYGILYKKLASDERTQ